MEKSISLRTLSLSNLFQSKKQSAGNLYFVCDDDVDNNNDHAKDDVDATSSTPLHTPTTTTASPSTEEFHYESEDDENEDNEDDHQRLYKSPRRKQQQQQKHLFTLPINLREWKSTSSAASSITSEHRRRQHLHYNNEFYDIESDIDDDDDDELTVSSETSSLACFAQLFPDAHEAPPPFVPHFAPCLHTGLNGDAFASSASHPEWDEDVPQRQYEDVMVRKMKQEKSNNIKNNNNKKKQSKKTKKTLTKKMKRRVDVEEKEKQSTTTATSASPPQEETNQQRQEPPSVASTSSHSRTTTKQQRQQQQKSQGKKGKTVARAAKDDSTTISMVRAAASDWFPVLEGAGPLCTNMAFAPATVIHHRQEMAHTHRVMVKVQQKEHRSMGTLHPKALLKHLWPTAPFPPAPLLDQQRRAANIIAANKRGNFNSTLSSRQLDCPGYLLHNNFDPTCLSQTSTTSCTVPTTVGDYDDDDHFNNSSGLQRLDESHNSIDDMIDDGWSPLPETTQTAKLRNAAHEFRFGNKYVVKQRCKPDDSIINFPAPFSDLQPQQQQFENNGGAVDSSSETKVDKKTAAKPKKGSGKTKKPLSQQQNLAT